MTETAKLYELASLAEASYVLFDGLNGDFSSESVEVFLKNKDRNGNFSATQAEDFVANWSVVAHQKNVQDGWITPDSGFSATLFKNNEDPNEYVYATRGTEPGNWVDDIVVTDVGDIVNDGLAIKQIVDMYNDWQRLNAPEGEVYKVVQLDRLEAESLALQAEKLIYGLVAGPYEQSLRERTDVIIDGGLVYTIKANLDSDQVFSDERALGAGAIPSGSHVTVVGHSLGGHLAVAFSRLFPNVTDAAVTVNGAGFMTGAVEGLSGNAEVNIRNLFTAEWQQAA